MANAYSQRTAAPARTASVPTERCVVCGITAEVGKVVPHASRAWACRTEECAAGLIAGKRAPVAGLDRWRR